MPGVDGQRREDREDLLLEDAENPCFLRRVEVLDAREVETRAGETGHDRRLEHFVATRLETKALDADVLQLLSGATPVCRSCTKACRHMVLEAAHAHLEELVEPRREDGYELDTLEQRERHVRSEVNKAICEIQPGQLTVEEPVGVN